MNKRYSTEEEKFNFFTHLFTYLLLFWWASSGGIENYLAKALFIPASSTFLFSALYHGSSWLNFRKDNISFFRLLDIASIYILIGTTGFCWATKVNASLALIFLFGLPTLIAMIWSCFRYGQEVMEDNHTLLTVFCSLCSCLMFVLGDWSQSQFYSFFCGNFLYATGVLFYIKNVKWSHTIWHLFVSLATIVHIVGLEYAN